MTAKDPPELSVACDQPISPITIAGPRGPFPEGTLHHSGDEVFLAGHMPVQGSRLGSQQMSDSAHREHFQAFGVGDRDAGSRDPLGVEWYGPLTCRLSGPVLRRAGVKAGRIDVAISRYDCSDARHRESETFGAQQRVHSARGRDGDVPGPHDFSRRGERVSRPQGAGDDLLTQFGGDGRR